MVVVGIEVVLVVCNVPVGELFSVNSCDVVVVVLVYQMAELLEGKS